MNHSKQARVLAAVTVVVILLGGMLLLLRSFYVRDCSFTIERPGHVELQGKATEVQFVEAAYDKEHNVKTSIVVRTRSPAFVKAVYECIENNEWVNEPAEQSEHIGFIIYFSQDRQRYDIVNISGASKGAWRRAEIISHDKSQSRKLGQFKLPEAKYKKLVEAIEEEHANAGDENTEQ